MKVVEEPFDLYAESGSLSAYKGMTLSHFDARENKLQVGVTQELHVGEVIGEVDESSIRKNSNPRDYKKSYRKGK